MDDQQSVCSLPLHEVAAGKITLRDREEAILGTQL